MAALFVLTIAGTIALASLVYVAVEKPAIALGKRAVHARCKTMAMEVAP